MLEYKETNWKYQRGFKTREYDLVIDTILASKTMKEQQTKIEKISLVAFLNKEQRKFFVNICRRLKRNDKDFYQNKNLHATLFGFGPLKKNDYERIRRKIQQFTESEKQETKIYYFSIRPGTIYFENKTIKPSHGMSNGTVIAIGEVSKMRTFVIIQTVLFSFKG